LLSLKLIQDEGLVYPTRRVSGGCSCRRLVSDHCDDRLGSSSRCPGQFERGGSATSYVSRWMDLGESIRRLTVVDRCGRASLCGAREPSRNILPGLQRPRRERRTGRTFLPKS